MITAKYILATIAIVLIVIYILIMIAIKFNKIPINTLVKKTVIIILFLSPILSLVILILDILITLIA